MATETGNDGDKVNDNTPPEKSSGLERSSLVAPSAKNFRVSLVLAGFSFGCLFLYSISDPLNLLPSFNVNSRPQAQMVSLDTVLQDASMSDNKTVIMTALNEAWAEPGSVFDLFLESFRIGNGTESLLNNLVVIALDKKAYLRCQKVHRHCYALTTAGADFSGEAEFMSEDYLNMMWRRIDFLRLVLDKGYDFVFTDTDIMWLRNPFNPFQRFLPDGDFQIACDYFNGNPRDVNNAPNGGFTYVRSNNRSIQFYKFWYESRTQYPGNHDQDVLNQIKTHPYLTEIGVQIRFLDTGFFGGFCQVARDMNLVCTMHANCCVGLDRKIHDLRRLLKDWRNFVSGKNNESKWSVPHECLGSSFSTPHKSHKHHQLRRLLLTS